MFRHSAGCGAPRRSSLCCDVANPHELQEGISVMPKRGDERDVSPVPEGGRTAADRSMAGWGTATRKQDQGRGVEVARRNLR